MWEAPMRGGENVFFFLFYLVWRTGGGLGSPTFDLGLDMDICKSPSPLLRQRRSRCHSPSRFGAHVAGYQIQENTHNELMITNK